MKRVIFLFLGIFVYFLIPKFASAQEVLNGVYERKHFAERRPVPYQSIREADMMWSKTIWRKVDLRQKINLQYYYPEQPMDGRLSLIDLFMWGIQKVDLTAYDERGFLGSDEFGADMTVKDIKDRFDAKKEKKTIQDPVTGQTRDTTIEASAKTWEVKSFLVKEVWFFDKQRSVLDVRVVGICPIREYYRPEDTQQEDLQLKKLFWIYFPEARKILANHDVFNAGNDSERRTFDDLFFKRIFSSYIIQESNMYNNRNIEQYSLGMEQLMEADRVKENIFNMEQDLWEY